MANEGLDPLPGWQAERDDGTQAGQPLAGLFPAGEGLTLISAAAHHFVTSSFANRPDMLQREGEPYVEIHPQDATARGIGEGDRVLVENGRGRVELIARISDGVRPGVLASPKGRWSKLGNGRNVNWLTSDVLGDMAGQSTFHSNRVWIRKATSASVEM